MTEVLLTSGTSWTVPSDCVSATVECIGGGQGGNATNGGNGGDYAKAANLALNPGDTIAVQIGAGGAGVASGAQNAGTDTKFGSTVLAKGGGSASADVGDVSFAGGGGDSSGAGGAAAGPGGVGASASGTTPGAGDGDIAGAGGAPAGSGSTEPPVVVRVHSVAAGANGKLSFTGLTPTDGNQLYVVAFHGGAQTSSAPTGFVLVDTNPPADPGNGLDLYTKKSDGTETEIDVPVSSNSSSGFLIEVSGQNATNPTNLHSIAGSDTSSNTANFPTGTPTVANTLAIGFAAWSTAGAPPTQSSGWTFLSQTAASGGMLGGCASQTQGASLTPVSGSMTTSGATGHWTSALLLIAP